MGEYEELNDLVRDGSKKLRESKSLSDEAMFLYNRPRPVPPYITSLSNQSVVTGMTSSMNTHSNLSAVGNLNSQDNNNGMTTTVSSPTNRKRVLDRSRYKNVPRSAPPKLKGHPRDTRPTHRSRKDGSNGSSGPTQPPQPSSHHRNAPSHHPHHNQYFREQCNFFPPGPHSNWAEALGFSVNSLWNCGANNGHMSPTSHSVSPRSQTGGYAVHDDAHRSSSIAYSNGNSAPPGGGGYGRHGSVGSNNGYQYGYEEGRDPSSTGGGGGHGHYDGYHGRSRNGGMRDTVVM